MDTMLNQKPAPYADAQPERQIKTPAKDQARQSYTGSRLTDAQFEEAWNIAAIIHREIHRTGSFIKKLARFTHAIADQDKVDASKEETTIRDIYTARYGKSMNETREALQANEDRLRDTGNGQPLHYACMVGTLIETGPTMPFYQAYDIAAVDMARQFGITEAGAKSMMKEAFQEAEGRDLYVYGKALEKEHHIPVREAERAARQVDRQRSGPSR